VAYQITERFSILRGYHDDDGFHPNGKPAVSIGILLGQLGFVSIADFSTGYASLSAHEIARMSEK